MKPKKLTMKLINANIVSESYESGIDGDQVHTFCTLVLKSKIKFIGKASSVQLGNFDEVLCCAKARKNATKEVFEFMGDKPIWMLTGN